MLAGMLVQRTRVLRFTLAAVALFMAGCAATVGTGADPETPEAVVEDESAAAPVDTPPPAMEAVQQPPEQPVGPVAYTNADGGYADTDPSALTAFRDELAPHGAWVQDPVYGVVWVPAAAEVGADFAPYVTSGHWALSDGGDWLWVSDYSWGWATFHYGRWVWIPGTGWAWIPGRQYAPAWVVWRVGDPGYDYIGWAPMPPDYYWYDGVAVSLWVVPPAPYVFCDTAYIFDPYPYHHVIIGAHMHDAAAHTHYYRPPYGAHRGHGGYPHGPSAGEARIPASAIPRTPAHPEPRAVAAARPAAGSSSAPGDASGRRASAPSPGGRSAIAPSPAGRASAVSAPTYRGQGARAVAPIRRAQPLAPAPAYRAAPAMQRPTVSPPPAGRPSYNYGQPSYRQPSYGQPSYRPPSYNYGQPSYRQPSYAPRVPSGQSYAPYPRSSGPVMPYQNSYRPGGEFRAPTAPAPAVVRPSNKPSAAPATGGRRGGRR